MFAGRCVRRGCIAGVGCTDDVADGNGAVCPVGATAGGTTASSSDDGFICVGLGVVSLLGEASGLSNGVDS